MTTTEKKIKTFTIHDLALQRALSDDDQKKVRNGYPVVKEMEDYIFKYELNTPFSSGATVKNGEQFNYPWNEYKMTEYEGYTFEDLVGMAAKVFYAQYGFDANGFAPVISYNKYEAATVKVKERYIRLFKYAMRQVSTLTHIELHQQLAPLHGSLEVFQRGLLGRMEEWLSVYCETYAGKANLCPISYTELLMWKKA